MIKKHNEKNINIETIFAFAIVKRNVQFRPKLFLRYIDRYVSIDVR